MPWLIPLKLIAGNALGKLWAFLTHLKFWQLASLALAALCLLLVYQRNDARHDRDSYKTQRDYFRSELQRTIDKYTAAQRDAAAKNKADVARIEARQKEITDEKVSALNARLQLIARELREHPDAKGATEQPPISKDGTTPCRAFDPAWLCVSPADRLRAAQNEERHDQLINWVIDQSKIDTTGTAGK